MISRILKNTALFQLFIALHAGPLSAVSPEQADALFDQISVETAGGPRVKIFGYGSLMHPESASATIDEEVANSGRPAIALGVRRIFSLDPGEGHVSARWGAPLTPEHRAFLALEAHDSSWANGIIFAVDRDDFTALLEREHGYGLSKMTISSEQGFEQDVYAFTNDPNSPYFNYDVMPNVGYHFKVIEGAALYGEEFLELYLRSTYLGDGTRLDHWNTQKALEILLESA